jgi:chaperonin GroEL (HSP60 family)
MRSSAQTARTRSFLRRNVRLGTLSVVVGKILDKDQYNYGFDAQTGEYDNLVSKGIIDPTKVWPPDHHRTDGR